MLDAGCGTGRVGRELARRGWTVVGVDVDASMLDTARRLSPQLTWVHADLADPAGLALGSFEVVLLAGNVPLFTPPGTQPALVATCAGRLAPDGVLVAGFSTDRGYDAAAYDEDCRAAGLEEVDRFATWDQAAWSPGDDYAVSVHRVAPRGRR